MGYSIVPHKGEPTMCDHPCDHKDCALWREFFNSKCEICEKPFEEGQAYYQTEPGRKLKDGRQWVHAACEEERIEAEEVASANEEGEFSEATIEGIRTREEERQRKILEVAEGCSEGKRLFSIAWDAPAEDHGALYADYLEHLTKCKECIATFKLTDANIQRLKNDADGYRRGAEVLKKERSKDKT